MQAFADAWLPRLTKGADVVFHADCWDNTGIDVLRAPVWELADQYVSQSGFKAIGRAWHTLCDPKSPKSCVEPVAEALRRDLVFSSREWLTEDESMDCASQFLGSFKSGYRTILTNRIRGGWNPISDWTMEWAFIAYDNSKIALLLFRAED